MCNSPKKMLCISGYTLKGNLPGTNTFSQKRKQLWIPVTKNILVTGTQVNTIYKQQTSHILYKRILNPIWTYGIQLRGTASTANIEILERFQSKALRIIVDTPWYVPNTVIWRDLQTPTVKKATQRYSSEYSAPLSAHTNDLTVNLMELPDDKRLRRHLPNDLPIRFLV
jgi:hypothetical protein